MKDEKIHALAYMLLENVQIVFSAIHTSEIKLTKSDEIFTLCTKSFIITYSKDDTHFYLTFMIGQTGKEIGNALKHIMSVLEPHEFTITDDSYYDRESEQLVFGFEALEIRQSEILQSSGKIKCPMCDRIMLFENVTDKGICKICDSIKEKMIWN